MVLHTVGHGTRSLDELRAVLADAGVTRLADVRRFPGSRRHPHLARSSLGQEIDGYEWWGEDLGGRRSRSAQSRHTAWENPAFAGYADHMDTPAFRQSLTRLLELAADQPTAVMCAETVWWRCHRRLIADAAVLLGTDVVHLMDVGKRDTHKLTAFARRGDDGWPVYDGGQPSLL